MKRALVREVRTRSSLRLSDWLDSEMRLGPTLDLPPLDVRKILSSDFCNIALGNLAVMERQDGRAELKYLRFPTILLLAGVATICRFYNDRGSIRTNTFQILSLVPLPLGYTASSLRKDSNLH